MQFPGLTTDPEDAAGVLAFVLCPAAAFGKPRDANERAAVEATLLAMKTEAIRRYWRPQGSPAQTIGIVSAVGADRSRRRLRADADANADGFRKERSGV